MRAIFLGIGILLLYAVVQYFWDRHRTLDGLRVQLVEAVASPGMFYDGVEVEQRIASFSHNPMVERIIVYSVDGRVLGAVPAAVKISSIACEGMEKIPLTLGDSLAGYACASFSSFPVLKNVFHNMAILGILTTLFLLIALNLTNNELNKFTEAFSHIVGRIRQRKVSTGFTDLQIDELNELTSAIIEFERVERELIREKENSAKIKAITTVANQVAHDIRSPLSALTMVIGTLKEIPEEKRILIRNATQRINDIANDLLQKGQKKNSEAGQIVGLKGQDRIQQDSSRRFTTEFIPALVDILVSEKRMQYREYSGLEIEVDLKDSFGAFAQINSTELKRVISNLINNAIEAFDDHQGRVTVGVRKISNSHNEYVEITVKDNGKGIPPHILTKLGVQGFSHGKEGTHSGSGLGIYHAKNTAESFGGNFKIESLVGHGTLIIVTLPLADSPNWFADNIDLTGRKYLVSLDDDISIHQIWSGRLQSAGYSEIEHIRFQSGEAFIQFINSTADKIRQTMFLVDYELLNQQKTGLDIIEELSIERYSILVTSRYEEANIQNRAAQLSLLLLPKALAGFVPFEMRNPKERFDLCLIDDDTQLIHPVWAAVAESKGLKIKMFASAQEFYEVADNIDRLTPIYVDVSLGNGINGTEVALEIYRLGFSEICLATGYEASTIDVPSFIRRVVGKDFPI